MLKKLLLYSLRSLKRQKSYILINILGLSIALACCLLIALFITFELSYDKFNENGDNIYRVLLDGKIGGQEIVVSATPSPLGPAMLNDFPEVENYSRIVMAGETIVRYLNETFTEDAYMQADSGFFEIFTFPLIRGDKSTVLNEPYKVVISESTAKKIFGEEDPINKMIKISTDTNLYTISGIMTDLPVNCHFEANIITSFMTNPRADDGQWLSNSFGTYVVLNPNSDPVTVNEKFHPMLVENVGPTLQQMFGISFDDFVAQGNKYSMYLQPLLDIHLNPGVQHDMKPQGDPKYLSIFGSVALLIIIIASINFMNLSTAQASRRAKEVGIKKVGGSSKGQLVNQFLLESIMLTLFSLVLAVVIVKLTLPFFNDLLRTGLSLHLISNWYTIPLLLLFSIVVGLLAGSYPAFYLSAINPAIVLKGYRMNGKSSGRLRRVLVIFQFAASIILIVGTMIIFKQIRFMLNRDLGFDKENLMVINRAGVIGGQMDSFKEELKKIPGVLNVATSTAVPNRNNNNNGYIMEGRDEEAFLMMTNWVDFDYFETYGLEVSDGRFFDESFPADQNSCILNESAVRNFSITDPFSTNFIFPVDNAGTMGEISVIGVTEDFHYMSMENTIEPYIHRFKTPDMQFGYISIRLEPNFNARTISDIESVWRDFSGDDPMQYYYMEEDIDSMYQEERQSAQLAIIFAILALFVASIGLFGLTAFTLQQRTREIGTRMAMGATLANIYYLITKDILVLVSISTILAWPAIFFVAKRWLESYYYKINLNPLVFLYGFLIALLLALITISYRTIKTARVSPSISLKYE